MTMNLIRTESTAHEALVRAVCRQFIESPELALTLERCAYRLRVSGTHKARGSNEE